MSLTIYINDDILLWGRLITVICRYVRLVVTFLIEETCLFYIRRTKRVLWGKGIFSDAKQGEKCYRKIFSNFEYC